MKPETVARYLGNALLILGYYILVWGDERSGLIVKMIGGLLVVPSFFYFKMWDALIICGFFTAIDSSRLIYILLGGRG